MIFSRDGQKLIVTTKGLGSAIIALEEKVAPKG